MNDFMLTAILIDDEELSLNSLKTKILKHCPQVKILAVCNNPMQGIEAIETLKPNILFLDIEMPGMNGFVLLQNLKYRDVEIVFVTAYDHYAIKAIKYSAFDYLVKPIEVCSLKESIKRLAEKKKSSSESRIKLLLDNALTKKDQFSKIMITSTDTIYFVNVDEIIYLESQANYSNVFLLNGVKYVTTRSLKEFQELLPENNFLRIHNSYIINLKFLRKYTQKEGGQIEMERNIVLPVSRRRKIDFFRLINKD
ncbi:MAG: response regulator transcription factor [Ferruginibacter sp.]|nr:response regulator transcription factor [Ferruginibacter sp.]